MEDDLITLDEAAKLIPGADANTLKRMCRKGLLTCYRPGKAYLTTRANVSEAVKKSAVHRAGNNVAMDRANAALDAALIAAHSKRKRGP